MSDQSEGKRPVRITREDLHKQVWETPMSRLAEQYGISGNGLAKICDRLKVPYPPRGYWAKKAAGKKVINFRLPGPEEDTPREVTITPTMPTPDLPPEVEETLEISRSKAEQLQVPERLSKPHSVIAGWLANHERRKEEARRERDPWRKRFLTPEEFTSDDRRRYRILDTLFKELERQGGRVREDERRQLIVEINGEPIIFQLREKQKQVRRPLTADEKRWRAPSDKGWRQELQPTGKLVLSIKTWMPSGLRSEWLENDAKAMEDLLPEIVAAFVAAGPLLAERTRQREEEKRQYQIAEFKRYEEQQRRKLEANRWRRFVELARRSRDAEIARAFIDEMKRLDCDQEEEIGGKKVREWIAWAEESAYSTDPLNHGVEKVFKAVGEITTWSYQD